MSSPKQLVSQSEGQRGGAERSELWRAGLPSLLAEAARSECAPSMRAVGVTPARRSLGKPPQTILNMERGLAAC